MHAFFSSSLCVVITWSAERRTSDEENARWSTVQAMHPSATFAGATVDALSASTTDAPSTLHVNSSRTTTASSSGVNHSLSAANIVAGASTTSGVVGVLGVGVGNASAAHRVTVDVSHARTTRLQARLSHDEFAVPTLGNAASIVAGATVGTGGLVPAALASTTRRVLVQSPKSVSSRHDAAQRDASSSALRDDVWVRARIYK